MAYGARFYDASGNLIIDENDRLLRLHSSYSYSGLVTYPSRNYQVIYVSGMIDDGSWVVFIPNYIVTSTIYNGYFIVEVILGAFRYTGESGTAFVFRL